MVGLTAAAAGSVPLVGRQTGQNLARHELARSIYQPTIIQRILSWIGRLFNGAAGSVPGGGLGLLLLAVILASLIAGVVYFARPSRSLARHGPAPISKKPRTAREHRLDAERHAAAGEHSLAIIERFRAVAAELDERGVVPPRPGRTADEMAIEAARRLPALTDGLRSAARLFDEVRYGDQPGSAGGYRLVCQVDDYVVANRPAAGGQRAELAGSGPAGQARP